jgi:Fe2+ transport system protein FeoA
MSELSTEAVVGLDVLSEGQRAEVVELVPAGLDSAWLQRLQDLGLEPGHRLDVVARAWPAHHGLVVRLAQGRLALRFQEAACVRVRAIREVRHA